MTVKGGSVNDPPSEAPTRILEQQKRQQNLRPTNQNVLAYQAFDVVKSV